MIIDRSKQLSWQLRLNELSLLSLLVDGLCPMQALGAIEYRVTTCLENLEMSGNVTAVRDMSGILLKIREMSEKNLSGKSCLKLFIVNCIFVSIQVFSRSQFCVKYQIYGFGSCTVAFLPPPLIVTLVRA